MTFPLRNCDAVGRSPAPIEAFETSARDLSAHFQAFARSNLEDGWTRDGFSIPSVFPPIDWGAHNRSFSYHLHAWDAIADLLIAHSRLQDGRYLDACVAHARAWLEAFQAPVLGCDSDDELDALVRPAMPVEWYDMAVGLRAYRLAYLLDAMLSSRRFEDDVPLFRSGLYFHLKLLGREHFFRAHSNHGLFQALGQVAAARRFLDWPEMEIHYSVGLERLKRLLHIHFSAEGPHQEHSPGYHYMIMGSLINARRSGLLLDEEFEPLVEAIENAFQWMVKPDVGLATFGDTDPRILVRGAVIAGLYRNKAAQHVISGGELGETPPVGVQAYYESGYAIARLHAPAIEPTFENASYLAQMAAFHSRVHKHADHLGFIWYDRGRDILIDPGRYAYAGRTEVGSDLFNQGFWYADPRRVYVESTNAHNCVEIDAKSYPRKVKATGSALRHASEQGVVAVTECEMTHFRTIRHRRALVMAPRRFLFVLDWLNDRGAPHDYRQWFQFAPEWQVSPTDKPNVMRADAQGEAGPETVLVVNLMAENVLGGPIRGQTEPVMQGWMSDAPYSLVPSTSIAVLAESRQMARFATLFVFASDISIDRPATRFNTSMKTGVVSWSDENGGGRLILARDAEEAISVEWRPHVS